MLRVVPLEGNKFLAYNEGFIPPGQYFVANGGRLIWEAPSLTAMGEHFLNYTLTWRVPFEEKRELAETDTSQETKTTSST